MLVQKQSYKSSFIELTGIKCSAVYKDILFQCYSKIMSKLVIFFLLMLVIFFFIACDQESTSELTGDYKPGYPHDLGSDNDLLSSEDDLTGEEKESDQLEEQEISMEEKTEKEPEEEAESSGEGGSDSESLTDDREQLILVPRDYPTIQESIDAAVDGDKIQIAPGHYQETIIIDSKNITLTGNDPNNSELVESTVIDGNGKGPVVSFKGLATRSAVLKGLTITGGVTSKNGGGIKINNASPTIKNNMIISNQAAGRGGGIYVSGWASPLLKNNQILDNQSERGGGGLALDDCLPMIIENNYFAGNRTSFGAAIFLGAHCQADFGQPDRNSYQENGSRAIYYEKSTEPSGYISSTDLLKYSQAIDILGEPLVINELGWGLYGYEFQLVYDGIIILVSNNNKSVDALHNSNADAISYEITSEKFIDDEGVRIGDSATSVLNRHDYNSNVDYKPESGISLLYYEETLHKHDEYQYWNFSSGYLYYDHEQGGPVGLSYSSGIPESCGGNKKTYYINDGLVEKIIFY